MDMFDAEVGIFDTYEWWFVFCSCIFMLQWGRVTMRKRFAYEMWKSVFVH